jgi:hypothetical protein
MEMASEYVLFTLLYLADEAVLWATIIIAKHVNNQKIATALTAYQNPNVQVNSNGSKAPSQIVS